MAFTLHKSGLDLDNMGNILDSKLCILTPETLDADELEST
jgi:hypothetical protein